MKNKNRLIEAVLLSVLLHLWIVLALVNNNGNLLSPNAKETAGDINRLNGVLQVELIENKVADNRSVKSSEKQRDTITVNKSIEKLEESKLTEISVTPEKVKLQEQVEKVGTDSTKTSQSEKETVGSTTPTAPPEVQAQPGSGSTGILEGASSEGEVIVIITTDGNGFPTKVEITKSTGNVIWDEQIILFLSSTTWGGNRLEELTIGIEKERWELWIK